jgi:hypothetical protein
MGAKSQRLTRSEEASMIECVTEYADTSLAGEGREKGN